MGRRRDFVTPSALDHLWGARLEHIQFDVTARSLRLLIDVTSNGGRSSWALLLTDVTDVHITRPDPSWDYTETTEFHLSDGAGVRQIEVVFWVEPNGLSSTFDRLELVQIPMPDLPNGPVPHDS